MRALAKRASSLNVRLALLDLIYLLEYFPNAAHLNNQGSQVSDCTLVKVGQPDNLYVPQSVLERPFYVDLKQSSPKWASSYWTHNFNYEYANERESFVPHVLGSTVIDWTLSDGRHTLNMARTTVFQDMITDAYWTWKSYQALLKRIQLKRKDPSISLWEMEEAAGPFHSLDELEALIRKRVDAYTYHVERRIPMMEAYFKYLSMDETKRKWFKACISTAPCTSCTDENAAFQHPFDSDAAIFYPALHEACQEYVAFRKFGKSDVDNKIITALTLTPLRRRPRLIKEILTLPAAPKYSAPTDEIEGHAIKSLEAEGLRETAKIEQMVFQLKNILFADEKMLDWIERSGEGKDAMDSTMRSYVSSAESLDQLAVIHNLHIERFGQQILAKYRPRYTIVQHTSRDPNAFSHVSLPVAMEAHVKAKKKLSLKLEQESQLIGICLQQMLDKQKGEKASSTGPSASSRQLDALNPQLRVQEKLNAIFNDTSSTDEDAQNVANEQMMLSSIISTYASGEPISIMKAMSLLGYQYDDLLTYNPLLLQKAISSCFRAVAESLTHFRLTNELWLTAFGLIFKIESESGGTKGRISQIKIYEYDSNTERILTGITVDQKAPVKAMNHGHNMLKLSPKITIDVMNYSQPGDAFAAAAKAYYRQYFEDAFIPHKDSATVDQRTLDVMPSEPHAAHPKVTFGMGNPYPELKPSEQIFDLLMTEKFNIAVNRELLAMSMNRPHGSLTHRQH